MFYVGFWIQYLIDSGVRLKNSIPHLQTFSSMYMAGICSLLNLQILFYDRNKLHRREVKPSTFLDKSLFYEIHAMKMWDVSLFGTGETSTSSFYDLLDNVPETHCSAGKDSNMIHFLVLS
jgi:hypothetical protein